MKRKNNILSIFCAVLLSGAVFVSPIFAEMKEVNEMELARANASVIRVAISETGQVNGTLDKTAQIFSPSVIVDQGFNQNRYTTSTWYNLGAFNSSYWGGNVTAVITQ